MNLYVVVGPKTIGNPFGTYGTSVPSGKFAIVYDGEYNNGGYGPSAAKAPNLFDSKESAEKEIARRQ